MKLIYLLQIFATLISCTFSNEANRNYSNLPDKNDFITFNIDFLEKDLALKDNIKIKLMLKNISGKKLKITEPTWFGINIMPFLLNSKGELLPILFRIRAYCNPKINTLMKNEEYETIFVYNIEKCFDLTVKGNYDLKFEYYGNIYNISDEKIANDKLLSSNALELIL